MSCRKSEFEVKVARLSKVMDEKQLTGILLKKQPNFTWLTAGGLNMVGIATEMGVASLLITKTGRYLIANNIEGPRLMQEEGLDELGFELLQHEWHVDREAELVRQVCGELTGVGADAAFGPCLNVEADIRSQRFALTDSEIERYLFLGEKLSAAIEKIMLGIRPGDTECEIAGRVGQELWKDRIDPTGFVFAADERAFAYRHPIPTSRMVKRYVMISVNARYKGLIATITRMLHFGRPDAGLAKQFADNLTIDCRMVAATRPGAKASAVFQTGVAAYRELGYGEEWRNHHQGGRMGYYARDIKVTEATPDIIEVNQAFCWNPSIAGTKIEDGFLVTNSGPQFITNPVIYPKIEVETDGFRMVRPGLLVLD